MQGVSLIEGTRQGVSVAKMGVPVAKLICSLRSCDSAKIQHSTGAISGKLETLGSYACYSSIKCWHGE